MEPRAQRAAQVEARQRAQGGQERLLRDVLGGGRVARHEQRRAMGVAPIPIEQLLDGSLGAAPRRPHERRLAEPAAARQDAPRPAVPLSRDAGRLGQWTPALADASRPGEACADTSRLGRALHTRAYERELPGGPSSGVRTPRRTSLSMAYSPSSATFGDHGRSVGARTRPSCAARTACLRWETASVPDRAHGRRRPRRKGRAASDGERRQLAHAARHPEAPPPAPAAGEWARLLCDGGSRVAIPARQRSPRCCSRPAAQ